MKTKIFLFSLLATTIMSCNLGKKTTTETNSKNSSEKMSIENTKWILNSFEGENIQANGQAIYFSLDSKTNRISGNSGCNTFMGTYKLEENNSISFTKLALTRMMCPDIAINESKVISIFELADNFTITNGELALNKAKMAPLATFKKAITSNNQIVEKYWKLKTLEGKDIKMADNQEREIFFTLKTDENRVTGFAGCNAISGDYTLEDGNRIRFKNMATTLMACPDVDVNESDFLKIFELTDNYTINNDVLSLNAGRRAPLAVFEAVYMQ
ncbi:META domain-containing protein [Polaribacter sp. IC073]|uniref:META domain-containing protein n=1 Tax=Polaribacter sp. IC073 TaxID=2508540 RepID=UPI0011BF2199|nr:META domain-containing protein [Polaribacter sp. IC073]TXD47207.1 META domain-containing protein [Polaribacter sp. IC073]